jgi:hypothetical protein
MGEGYHLKLADGPFEILMKELGIEPPKEVEGLPSDLDIDWFKKLLDDLGKDRKGKSTLNKWTCECGQNVRVGKKDWPGAVCNACGSQYFKVDKEAHQEIYKAPESN